MSFHVPEQYRAASSQHLGVRAKRGDPFGIFLIPGIGHRAPMKIIATDGQIDDESQGGGWEHVSVSTPARAPNWTEMCFVKDLFWDKEDCVVQFHPPESEYVNFHPYCLHLWRWTRGDFPRPPALTVGPKTVKI